MLVTLKAAVIDVWKSITTGYTSPKKVNTMTQKDVRKNNSMEMETILEGYTYPIKGQIGKYSSAKELWVSLEQLCSKVDTKDNSASTKESSSEYYEPNEDAGPNFSSETDNSNYEEEE